MALSFRFVSPYVPAFAHNPLPFLLDTLGTARETLDLCIDALGVDAVVAQVARIRDRGVKVRWVINLGSDEAGLERLLAQHGFKKGSDWRAIRSPHALFAQSFAVVDSHRVFYGTAPWTAEGFYLQDAVHVVADSMEFAQAFVRATEVYWNESLSISRDAGLKGFIPEFVSSIESVTVGPDQRISAFLTPYDGKLISEKLHEVISEAETCLFFALPSLSDPRLVDALEERAQSGIRIRGVLDAHLCKIEHFERAPALRALALSGKIRFLRAFGKQNRGFADLMCMKLVTADEQWTYVGHERLDARQDIRWSAEAAFLIDSLPVARQAEQAIEMMHEMARDGGHRFSRWAHAEHFAYPNAWSVEPELRRPVSREEVRGTVRAVPVMSAERAPAKAPARPAKAAPARKAGAKPVAGRKPAAKKTAVAGRKLKSVAPARKKVASGSKRKAA